MIKSEEKNISEGERAWETNLSISQRLACTLQFANFKFCVDKTTHVTMNLIEENSDKEKNGTGNN